MSENTVKNGRRFRAHHRGRGAQVFIYLGKLLRMFVYQNDWKVLPMAALIAGLVGMVIRRRMFVNMEGTLMGAFAVVCVCIWNGCFNSIQVICRERDVIKREHRSGMHISSYICSHMLYQLIICIAQVGVTLYVTMLTGVKYEMGTPMITPWFIVDFGISMLMITYASDMLSLWISTLARTTTTAMTIMPFVLIFQLVFSGGMLTLPAWTSSLTPFTISNPGLKVIAAQADTNNRPYATIASMVSKMRDNEIGGTVTLGQVLDLMADKDNPTIAEIRAKEIGKIMTIGEIKEALDSSESFAKLRAERIVDDTSVEDLLKLIMEADSLQAVRDYDFGLPDFTLGKLVEDILNDDSLRESLSFQVMKAMTVDDMLKAIDAEGLMEKYKDVQVGGVTTVGEAIDWLSSIDDIQAQRDRSFTLRTTVGKLLDMVGEDNVKTFLEEKAAAANYKVEYENNQKNILAYWRHLMAFVFGFALLAMITLEFIDKDKR